MKFIKNSQKGFTLIEILLVIAIVAMLSTLAVNGYLSYRKLALLGLNADNLISQVDEMKSRTLYGEVAEDRFNAIKAGLDGNPSGGSLPENKALCYGMYFQKENEKYTVSTFSQKFINKKVWEGDDVNGGFVYKGCEKFDLSKVMLAPIEKDEEVKFNKISSDSGSLVDTLVLRFAPPKGIFDLEINGSSLVYPESLLIEMQYGDGEESQYKKILKFDTKDAKFTQ